MDELYFQFSEKKEYILYYTIMGKSKRSSEKSDRSRLYRRHAEKKDDEAGTDVQEESNWTDQNEMSAAHSRLDSTMNFGDSGAGFRPEPYHDESGSENQTKSDDDDADDDDDEIEVIKANIFKYQGDLTEHQQVSLDILHFEYYDDFNDEEEVVIIEDDDPELNESMDTLNSSQNTYVCCEECGDLFPATELEDHKEVQHPPKKKTLKQFSNGNFFMLAD